MYEHIVLYLKICTEEKKLNTGPRRPAIGGPIFFFCWGGPCGQDGPSVAEWRLGFPSAADAAAREQALQPPSPGAPAAWMRPSALGPHVAVVVTGA
jgi:hypothetical protein